MVGLFHHTSSGLQLPFEVHGRRITPGWHFACSKTGYTDMVISLYCIWNVFDLLTRDWANGKSRILIKDGFGTYESLELMNCCFENNIILCRLPSRTSHKPQPCDVGVFGPFATRSRLASGRSSLQFLPEGGQGGQGVSARDALEKQCCSSTSASSLNNSHVSILHYVLLSLGFISGVSVMHCLHT
jgi:hypothetical protein